MHFFEEGVQAKTKEIDDDIMDNVLLQDKDIQKLDLALKKIMEKKDNNKPSSSSAVSAT